MTMIIVVEPHALLRLGILQLLSDLSPSVKLEGSDYSCFSREMEPRPCDLVLLSISSPEQVMDLVSATERVFSPKSIILLAENKSMQHPLHGLPPAVAGYVTKCAAPEVLQASIRLVLAGGTCFPLRSTAAPLTVDALPPLISNDSKSWPPPAEPLLAAAAAAQGAGPRRAACAESEMLGLTPRQYEVLVLLARGYPLKTVGRYLNISVATAKAHTETLYQRLDVHNRNAAVYAAVSRGAKLGWPSIGGAPDPTIGARPSGSSDT